MTWVLYYQIKSFTDNLEIKCSRNQILIEFKLDCMFLNNITLECSLFKNNYP